MGGPFGRAAASAIDRCSSSPMHRDRRELGPRSITLHEAQNLERVFDKWYDPKSPTYSASVSPHSIVISTRLVGEKETCPLPILIGNDRAVYTGVKDAQLEDVLRRFVEE